MKDVEEPREQAHLGYFHDRKDVAALKEHQRVGVRGRLDDFHDRKDVAALKGHDVVGVGVSRVADFHDRKDVAALKVESNVGETLKDLLISTTERTWPH